jgi:L-lactate dehydrogenase
MKKIAIIGAGAVGAHIAAAGILKGLSAEFLLLDANNDLETGQVLDLRDSILFSDSKNIRGVDFGDEDLSNADIFVITAGAKQKEGENRTQLLDRNVQILSSIYTSIGGVSRSAMIILVSNPVDILTEITHQIFTLPRGQIFGTGTLLDSSRMRWRVSEKFGVHPKNIGGYVLGEHGDSEFVAWSTVTVGGKRLSEVFSEKEKDDIEKKTREEAYEIIRYKGATFFGIGSATVEILSAILGDTKRILPVSAHLEGEYGLKNVSLGVPCVIGKKGVEKIWEIPLEKEEQRHLHASAEKLKKIMAGIRSPNAQK